MLNISVVVRYMIIAGSVLLLASCKSNQGVQNGKQAIPVSFSSVQEGGYCGISSAQSKLIKSRAEFITLWREFGKIQVPPPEMPKIDFEKQWVVVDFMGDKSNGGFKTKIKEIIRTKDKLAINIIHFRPGKNCIVASAITQPYSIAAFDKQPNLDVQFQIEEQISDCR